MLVISDNNDVFLLKIY